VILLRFIHHILRFCVVLLFTAFGTLAAFAAPEDWTRISYPVMVQAFFAQSVNLTNTARAPPTASANVMATGTAFEQTGNLRALDGVKTTGAIYALLPSSNAPNSVVRSADDLLTNGRVPGVRSGEFNSWFDDL